VAARHRRAAADLLVVDLGAVTYLDSTALGAIVAVRKRQREHGGDVIVTNANRRLAKIFQLTGPNEVIEINGLGHHAANDDGHDSRSASHEFTDE
jgi:anti-anti-sigma factor